MTAKRYDGFSQYDSERSEHLTAKHFDSEQSELSDGFPDKSGSASGMIANITA